MRSVTPRHPVGRVSLSLATGLAKLLNLGTLCCMLADRGPAADCTTRARVARLRSVSACCAVDHAVERTRPARGPKAGHRAHLSRVYPVAGTLALWRQTHARGSRHARSTPGAYRTRPARVRRSGIGLTSSAFIRVAGTLDTARVSQHASMRGAPTPRSIPHAAGDRALKPGMGLTGRPQPTGCARR